MSATETEIPFDKQFVRKLVSILIYRPDLATRVASVLRPDWIEDKALADVADVSIEFIKKYKQVPTTLVLKRECGQDVVESPVFGTLKKLSKSTDLVYVTEKLTEYCRMQALRIAVIESAKSLRDGKTDGIIDKVQDALKVGADFSDLGTRFSDWKDRAKLYLEGDSVLGVVASGWDHVDQILGGGLGSGELGVIMAATGVGKSHAMANIGLCAALAGKKVLHYTFEMKAARLLRRYDKRFVAKHANLLSVAPEKFIKKLARQHRLLKLQDQGDIVVKYAPTRSFTPSMLRAHLDAMYMAYDYKPDIILVDYGDIMKAERRLGETRHEQASIFEDLRGIAGEYDIPLWSATQANRAALEKKVIRKQDVGESFEKVQIADVVISLCQTPEEKEENQMRLFFAKMRDAADEKTVSAYVDLSASVIRTTGISVPVPVEKGSKKAEERDEERARRMRKAAEEQGGGRRFTAKEKA